jgi:hypothetical protein
MDTCGLQLGVWTVTRIQGRICLEVLSMVLLAVIVFLMHVCSCNLYLCLYL